ncbi:hypothetical protein M5C99_00375 [Acidovorax sp. NCPPB 2350]|nr:hypothetical protein M5C99_00375 [Acidovorax sp. NCPPB 2350]
MHGKPHGRALAGFVPLSHAEMQLLLACAEGQQANLGSRLPTARTSGNAVRAGFVAFLAMGGDDRAPVHHKGLQLQGAFIEGALDLCGASVTGLALRHCHFDQALAMEGCFVKGTLSLMGSRIPGLNMDRAVVQDSVSLKDVHAQGKVRLLGAQIGGSLQCQNARFDGKQGDALSMDRIVVKGSVFLTEAKADGGVRLLGAQIGSILTCQKAQLAVEKGDALRMDRAVVQGSVMLTEMHAKGGVRLQGMQIGSTLECQKAELDGQEKAALLMDGTVVQGFASFREMRAMGMVHLIGAQIGSNLACHKASFDGREGGALTMDRVAVNGSVFLNEMQVKGTVRLPGAQIGGNLNCSDWAIAEASQTTLVADGAQVAGTLFLRRLSRPLNGVNLSGFRVGRLVDDNQAWGTQLVLDGFEYGAFAGTSPVHAAHRIAWLKRQRDAHLGRSDSARNFRPRPWRHLQKVLRETGHAEDARQVAIAFEDHVRSIGLIRQVPEVPWPELLRTCYGLLLEFLHRAFGVLIGYGYRPLRLVKWMVLVWLVGAAIFWAAALQGIMGPSNPLVFNDPKLACACRSNWYLCPDLPEEYTGFSPLAYSLDLLLPLVNLQQETDWAPLVPTPQTGWRSELVHWSWKHATRMVVWFEILFGWISSLLLVAVFSGLAKRRDE